ncbi:hypothetical protein D3C86_1930950 [compost metagenome]
MADQRPWTSESRSITDTSFEKKKMLATRLMALTINDGKMAASMPVLKRVPAKILSIIGVPSRRAEAPSMRTMLRMVETQ